MAGNNLVILDAGIDHCYLNGIPIVEAEIDILEVFKKVARISSLAVQSDPYFNDKTNAQKLFSESHGEGDRITTDFLEEGARDILPIFRPFQRLIPDGVYDTTPVDYESKSQQSDFSWTNPDPSNIFVNSILVKSTSGNGDITFIVNGIELGTVTLPDFQVNSPNYLAYDLAGFLGGSDAEFFNYSHSENVRNNNIAQTIECVVSNATGDFVYDVKVCAVKYDAVGWRKALVEAGDIALPRYRDDIRISHLVNNIVWPNNNEVVVTGVTIKHNCGSAYVTVSNDENTGAERFLDSNTIGEDYYNSSSINSISIDLRAATDDFSYDLIINTELPKTIPSPAFEFDSSWNPGKIIFRYQNMDTRSANQKLNYTSQTLRDIRVDPNIFEDVKKYTEDSLKNYVLKELYEAIGYDKKAYEYARKYEQSRSNAKFWLRSEKGLQTQYHHAGV